MNYIRIKDGLAITKEKKIPAESAADLYHAIGNNYPKFFKMDMLSKWAWLGAELLFKKENGSTKYDGIEKNKVAVVLATSDGCLEVDKRFSETIQTVASPALFVYTLPNIMLGEICIRHGFQGEQLCEVRDNFDGEELLFWVKDLLEKRKMTHCLFGKADATNEHQDICLFWADTDSIKNYSPGKMKTVYDL